jgi:hypothetical protein
MPILAEMEIISRIIGLLKCHFRLEILAEFLKIRSFFYLAFFLSTFSSDALFLSLTWLDRGNLLKSRLLHFKILFEMTINNMKGLDFYL